MKAPTHVSPWELTMDEAHALDTLVTMGADLTQSAAHLGVSELCLQMRVDRARERFRRGGGFIPSELTLPALVVLWSAWRKRQWTETLAA